MDVSIWEVEEAGRFAEGKGGGGCDFDENVVLKSPGFTTSKVKSNGVFSSVERNLTPTSN